MQLESMSLPERRARSALLVLVPEVLPLIEMYRRSYTADGGSVPPHITLLCPFLAPKEVTAAERQRIAQVVAGVPRFDFTLTGVNQFPTGVMYLAPTPPDPFRTLIGRPRPRGTSRGASHSPARRTAMPH